MARALRIVSVGLLVIVGCGDDGGSSTSGASTMSSADGTTAASVSNSGTTPGDTTASGGGDDLLTTTAGSTAATAGDDEGGLPMGDNCRVAADCVLDDDCCHCGVYQDMLPDAHGCVEKACAQTSCEANGIPDPTPLCLEGNCLLPKVACDPASVTCDEAPPDCSGRAPQIVDGCYTQACIPLGSCEEVAYFGCDECNVGETCVRFSRCSGDSCTFSQACLPDPGAAVINCATSGDLLCGFFGPGYACYDEASGPYCCSGDAAACGSAG